MRSGHQARRGGGGAHELAAWEAGSRAAAAHYLLPCLPPPCHSPEAPVRSTSNFPPEGMGRPSREYTHLQAQHSTAQHTP